MMVMFTFVGWEGSSKIIGQTCRNAEMVAIRFLTGFLLFLQPIKHESKKSSIKIVYAIHINVYQHFYFIFDSFMS